MPLIIPRESSGRAIEYFVGLISVRRRLITSPNATDSWLDARIATGSLRFREAAVRGNSSSRLLVGSLEDGKIEQDASVDTTPTATQDKQ